MALVPTNLLHTVRHWWRKQTVAPGLKARLSYLGKNLTTAEAVLIDKKADLDREHARWSRAFGKFCAIDTETTGLSTANSRVLQISLMLFCDGKLNAKKSWLLNPGVRIPPNATKKNKITNGMIRGKPSFSDCALDIRRLAERYPLVGHNLKFDIEFLEEEFRRIGIALRPTLLFCTMRHAFGESVRIHLERERGDPRFQKLSALCADLEVTPAGDWHDADVDARAAGECFLQMAKNNIEFYRKEYAEARMKFECAQKSFDKIKDDLR